MATTEFSAKAGSDTLFGGYGDDRLYGGDGNDKIYAGSEDDFVSGGSGIDVLYGGFGDDRIYGGNGNDTIKGEVGADLLSGGAGNDSLEGGSGNDRLYGGSGSDALNGGFGNDTFYSGSGSDVFIYRDDSVATGFENPDVFAHDRIMDWDASNDRIYTLMDADIHTAGRQQHEQAGGPAANKYWIRAGEDFEGNSVFFDVDGDAVADLQIDVMGEAMQANLVIVG